MTLRIPSVTTLIVLNAALAVTLTAHSSAHQATSPTSSGRSATTVSAGTTPDRDTLTVSDAWVRATPPRAPVAGGFLSIRNNGRQADRLLSATSPDAARVEIHTMTMNDGVMRMRRIDDGLPITPGAAVTLAPGGEHLMFISPTRRFVEGETVTATLRFERAGERTVRFAVRAAGSGGH